jgi:hypothetical protein
LSGDFLHNVFLPRINTDGGQDIPADQPPSSQQIFELQSTLSEFIFVHRWFLLIFVILGQNNPLKGPCGNTRGLPPRVEGLHIN